MLAGERVTDGCHEVSVLGLGRWSTDRRKKEMRPERQTSTPAAYQSHQGSMLRNPQALPSFRGWGAVGVFLDCSKGGSNAQSGAATFRRGAELRSR